MLSRFLSLFNIGMRAYKVQDVKRNIRIGVVAKNVDDLIKKGCAKLQLVADDVRVVIEDDGTEVEDDAFFKQLPAQTVFVFLKEGETWHGSGDLIHDALSKLSDLGHRHEMADQIREMLTGEDAPEKIHLMSQYLDLLETDAESEKRYEHEDWFEGLNKQYSNKSDVLRQSAQTRVRSYFTTAKDQITKNYKGADKELLQDLLAEMHEELKKKDYHGNYFVRSAPAKDRMCDRQGWFSCQGAFDKETCEKFHTINPYASRGYRQLFGLWNLDHIIEKSREIIPALLEAADRKPKNKDLNWGYVYDLLFTRKNLKLVQVGCHKKAARIEHKCNRQDFYIDY